MSRRWRPCWASAAATAETPRPPRRRRRSPPPSGRSRLAAAGWLGPPAAPPGFTSLRFVTVGGRHRTDGFGAQIVARVGCMAQAAATPDLVYLHTPFGALDHSAANPELSGAEEFLGLGRGELSVSAAIRDGLVPDEGAILAGIGSDGKGNRKCQAFAEENPELLSALRPTLRARLFPLVPRSSCSAAGPEATPPTPPCVAVFLRNDALQDATLRSFAAGGLGAAALLLPALSRGASSASLGDAASAEGPERGSTGGESSSDRFCSGGLPEVTEEAFEAALEEACGPGPAPCVLLIDCVLAVWLIQQASEGGLRFSLIAPAFNGL